MENGDQDLVAFVGDLGDEDVELVQEVSAIAAEKAVILGNHDAWQSFSRRRPTGKLRQSLEALDRDHIAYAVREIPNAGISMIGARPFSWGGPSLRSPELYDRLYGITDMTSSADKIYEAARCAQHRDLVLLAHNGPSGLSRAPQDIYGKDFGRAGGDWGDPDLELAIQRIERSGWRVPCVIAGHMHHRLLSPRGALRTRFLMRGSTLYVNPAIVPRIRPMADGETVAHFVRMVWCEGSLDRVDEIWVDAHGDVREAHEARVTEV